MKLSKSWLNSGVFGIASSIHESKVLAATAWTNWQIENLLKCRSAHQRLRNLRGHFHAACWLLMKQRFASFWVSSPVFDERRSDGMFHCMDHYYYRFTVLKFWHFVQFVLCVTYCIWYLCTLRSFLLFIGEISLPGFTISKFFLLFEVFSLLEM